MKIRARETHPEGEKNLAVADDNLPMEVDTFDGKLQVEWDQDAQVTPLGQLPFFIQYLKLGHRFEPWVADCSLVYNSNNAPAKVDVLGSLLLSVLSGHRRYAHITSLMSDRVNVQLLGMNKIVSDDSARRALNRLDESAATTWLHQHLWSCYGPLLKTPWILDTDVTVKPLYGGHQEGACKGYNPHKPGRPSHTYHTYLIANLRLVLDVEVQAGDQSHSSHSLPGLMGLLNRLPADCRPEFIRGDCDWGNDGVMSELEAHGQRYLFKLKKSTGVKRLINQCHRDGDWVYFNDDFEVKESRIDLMGWKDSRRVIVVRRRVKRESILGLSYQVGDQQQLAFIDGPEKMKLHEYSVLVTNLSDDLRTVMQHYRDRADCENYFDEIKNQWGWGGFTTHNLVSGRIMSRVIALIYNWWTLFVRLTNPSGHLEAITSRPLLLSSVGRLTRSGRQKKMSLTTQHGRVQQIKKMCRRVTTFFNQFKRDAPQLSPQKCWETILAKAMEAFTLGRAKLAVPLLPAPS